MRTTFTLLLVAGRQATALNSGSRSCKRGINAISLGPRASESDLNQNVLERNGRDLLSDRKGFLAEWQEGQSVEAVPWISELRLLSIDILNSGRSLRESPYHDFAEHMAAETRLMAEVFLAGLRRSLNEDQDYCTR